MFGNGWVFATVQSFLSEHSSDDVAEPSFVLSATSWLTLTVVSAGLPRIKKGHRLRSFDSNSHPLAGRLFRSRNYKKCAWTLSPSTAPPLIPNVCWTIMQGERIRPHGTVDNRRVEMGWD